MAQTIWGRVLYPGILGVCSASYTCGHGISPGVATIVAQPQDVLPPVGGTITFYDGRRTIKIPDCRLMKIDVHRGLDGIEWLYRFEDRRWRWRDFGLIAGAYNQLDPAGKLIGWTVRAPRELAILCLRAMGEFRYQIDLPAGLSRAQAAAKPLDRFLRPGENFVPTGLNPPINWQGECPGQALARLADQFGRRVVYNLANDSLMIARPGVGALLPEGGESIASDSPSTGIPVLPDGIAIYGAPTRFQDRLALEAVGKEWDGSYRPINTLSYAPLDAGVLEAEAVTFNWATPLVNAGALEQTVDLTVTQGVDFPTSVSGSFQTICTGGSETPTAQVALLKNKINAWANGLAVPVTATASAGTLTVTASQTDVRIFLVGSMSANDGSSLDFRDDATTVKNFTVTVGRPPRADWSSAAPPLFPGVRATSRLLLRDAVRLAQESVWKCYRLTGRSLRPDQIGLAGPADPAGVKSMLEVPGYGRIKRVQQIVLENTKVEQIVPELADQAVQDRRRGGEAVVVNFYDGLSRDRPAAVYGVHAVHKDTFLAMVFGNNNGNGNTHAGSQVFVNFSVDPVWQMITFSNHVYRFGGGQGSGRRIYEEPDIVLETAFAVRNEETNQVECFVKTRRLQQPKGTTVGGVNQSGLVGGKRPTFSSRFVQGRENWVVQRREDVQLNVFRQYDAAGKRGRAVILEADPLFRADYYLDALAVQYLANIGESVKYNGLVLAFCDGAVSQVTWDIGPSGTTTTASRNNEHAVWLPPYPARRRDELLRPILAAGANPTLPVAPTSQGAAFNWNPARG